MVNFDTSNYFGYDSGVLRMFNDYLERVSNRFVLFSRVDDDGKKYLGVIKGSDVSRYFEYGRKRISKKIYKRLNRVVKGVFLTLTYDPNRISLEDAWANVGSDWNRFNAAVNNYWKRKRGGKKSLVFSRVVEPQKNGYPHIHVVYPGLRYLADKDYIQSLWDRGYSRVDGFHHTNLGRYLSKYLAKVSEWPIMSLAYSWLYKVRWYQVSRRFYVSSDNVAKKWVFELAGCGWDEFKDCLDMIYQDYNYVGLSPLGDVAILSYIDYMFSGICKVF